MADAPVVHIGENSPEYVAYKLLHDIAMVEKKAFHSNPRAGYDPADRKWILRTYVECVDAVRDGKLTAP